MNMRRLLFWVVLLIIAYFVWTRFLRGKMSGG